MADGDVLQLVDGHQEFAPSPGGVFVGCKVYTQATQSLTNQSEASVSFASEEYDTHGFHEGVTNPTRLTVPAGWGGTYRLTAAITFAFDADGTRQIHWRKNGSTVIRGSTITVEPVDVQDPTSLVSTVEVELAEGDYVEVRAYHDAGNSLNIGANNEYYASVASITKIG